MSNHYQHHFMAASIESCTKQLSAPVYSHAQRKESNEIFFVTEGFFIRGCSLQDVQINANELHLSLAGQITSLRSFSDHIKGYYCYFNNQFLNDADIHGNLLQELAFINSFMFRYPLKLTKGVSGRVSALFQHMSDLSGASEPDFRLVRSYLVTLVYEIKKELLDSVADPYPSKPFQLARQYNDLLLEHITKHHHIDFYASRLGISPNHLNKSVKLATGKTASSILNETRVLEAKIQLKQTTTSVGDIAFNLGFDDPSYFTKCFKKATGLAPLEYRNL